MSVRRLAQIPGFNIDRVAAAAGTDPDILRMENLDTDIPPPEAAMEATRAAIGEDEANSWLPFTGRDDLKDAVAAYVKRHGGPRYDGRREIVITCRERDLRLLYWGGFEGVLFDGRPIRHPAALAGMRDRTVTVGSPTLEQRMIAWRIGWVVAPGDLANDVSRVHIYNGLVPSGFNQIGTRVALGVRDEDLATANAEWQRRRDETLKQLAGLPVVRPAGGWSLLLDVAALGLDCMDVSARLLEQKVAATPMRGWGDQVANRHVRFVFSNEPVDRLAVLGERVHRALAGLGLTT